MARQEAISGTAMNTVGPPLNLHSPFDLVLPLIRVTHLDVSPSHALNRSVSPCPAGLSAELFHEQGRRAMATGLGADLHLNEE